MQPALNDKAICSRCQAAAFRHRKLVLEFCEHKLLLNIFDGQRWVEKHPCTRSEAYRICVHKSVWLWDRLSDTHGFQLKERRRSTNAKLNRLQNFLEGLRDAT